MQETTADGRCLLRSLRRAGGGYFIPNRSIRPARGQTVGGDFVQHNLQEDYVSRPSQTSPPPVLTSSELQTLRDSLEQYVTRLRTEVDSVEHDAYLDVRTSLQTVGDDVDRSGVAEDLEVSRSLAGNAQQLLSQCQTALERMADDTYGICAECGESIDRERLRALPHAALCVGCQSGPNGPHRQSH